MGPLQPGDPDLDTDFGNADMPYSVPEATDNDPPEQGEELPRQYERYLRVRNTTDQDLTIWVQFRTKDEEGNWAWMPADPAESKEASKFQFEAGKEAYLTVDEDKLHASRVRMWAKAANGMTYNAFADEDLWLVPEVDAKGKHYYYSRRMGTFSFTFSPGGADGAGAEEAAWAMGESPRKE
jgi:hypothetical protein